MYAAARCEHSPASLREDIVALAREYATTRPAAIRLNYGVQRSERGAMAVRAIACLPALIGSWKEVGGGLQLSTSQAFHLEQDRAGDARICSAIAARPRGAHRQYGRAGQGSHPLDDPPVKAMVVYNSNPAAIAPNQNLVLARDAPRRSVHRGAGAVSERHRGSCRYPAARHHVPGTHRPVFRLRPLLSAARASGAAARRAKPNRTWKCSGCSPRAWASTTPAFAIPKTT